MKLKLTSCCICGKDIYAAGRNLAICRDCNIKYTDKEIIEFIEELGGKQFV